MKRLAMCAVLAAALGASAAAQSGPPGAGPGGPPDGAPPAMQQQMEHARDDARSAALSALSTDHQAKVNAVLARVKGGQLTDPRDAAQQIDAVLTPKEAQSVLAARDKLRDDMRKLRAEGGGPPGGGPGGWGARPDGGNGGPPRDGEGSPRGNGGGPPSGGFRSLRSDAGFALLTLNLDREQMRSLFTSERPPR